jgi:hypothetical protein
MKTQKKIEPEPKIEYAYAFITEEGEVLPHFSDSVYTDMGRAKQDYDHVIQMLPEPLRELPTFLCKITTTYEIIDND